ncbi:hypothetical protein GH714_022971 [Hevea brasiliensis]|uniref:Uncharacterized protein n=1 Tax=Hevea brasiliensis TaxID=3981 RepID=A0A6A6LEE6_HEVBR|nr:hypothetical protein GH714_022971 [Hevea brasiliensis]
MLSSRRGPPLIVSGSDDGTAKLWDMRQRGAIQTFPDKYQITAVCFSDASDKIFTGGIDNDVKVWDLRKGEVTMKLEGHQDMITGMQLSPDGSYLLTNGMDCKLCIWDMRPYAPQNRCVKVLEGHQHNFEKNLLKCSWSPDGSKVTAGSSDRMVYIWDTTSRRILYKLPGHTGYVTTSGSSRWYAAHMVATSLAAIFQGSVSVLIFTQTGDFLGYLKSYVREEDGAVILKLAGGLCALIFCLEWVVLSLAFLLRYYAFVEGSGCAGGSSLAAGGKVQEEELKNWPWPFQV